MNYKIFDEMDGEYCRKPGETEQSYMERILRDALTLPSEFESTCFLEEMKPVFRCCSAEEMSCSVNFVPQQWQLNPNRKIINGGLILAAADMTFGLLTHYYIRQYAEVTMTLTVNYMRSIPFDHPYYVKAMMRKTGQRVENLYAEIIDDVTGALAADTTALFMRL